MTTVFAFLGFGLAVVSLLWQFKTHRDSGVRIDARFALALPEKGLAAPIGKTGPSVLAEEGEERNLLIVVHNTGRLPAVVTGTAFGTEDVMHMIEAPYPVQIDVSDEKHWSIAADEVQKLVDINRDAAKTTRDDFIATVILGNGKREHFKVSVLAVERAFQ